MFLRLEAWHNAMRRNRFFADALSPPPSSLLLGVDFALPSDPVIYTRTKHMPSATHNLANFFYNKPTSAQAVANALASVAMNGDPVETPDAFVSLLKTEHGSAGIDEAGYEFTFKIIAKSANAKTRDAKFGEHKHGDPFLAAYCEYVNQPGPVVASSSGQAYIYQKGMVAYRLYVDPEWIVTPYIIRTTSRSMAETTFAGMSGLYNLTLTHLVNIICLKTEEGVRVEPLPGYADVDRPENIYILVTKEITSIEADLPSGYVLLKGLGLTSFPAVADHLNRLGETLFKEKAGGLEPSAVVPFSANKVNLRVNGVPFETLYCFAALQDRASYIDQTQRANKPPRILEL